MIKDLKNNDLKHRDVKLPSRRLTAGLKQRPSIAGAGACFLVIAVLMVLATDLFAGMDVMTDNQLQDVQGGEILNIDISDPGYYNSSADVTVVRFSSDIYIENYGEFSELRLGNYERAEGELGPMLAADSDYVLAYTQDRDWPKHGNQGSYGTFGGSTAWPFGQHVNLRAVVGRELDDCTFCGSPQWDYVTSAYRNFGSSDGPAYSQWDINWEGLQMGLSEDNPMRLYGIVLRAEFSDFGGPGQELRRLIIGSNKLYGYGKASRPMVTSAWLNSQLTNIPDDVVNTLGADNIDAIFQMQRDMFLDQYWQISSFHLNPEEGTGFRQFIFNTNQNSVNLAYDSFDADGQFVDQNHGFFLSLDLTDERFSGWNILAGVNEYSGWPQFEDDSSNKWSAPPSMISPGRRPGY